MTATDFLNPSMIGWAIVLASAACGALVDARQRRLPNRLTLPLWLTGLAFAFGVGGWAGLGVALAASMILMLPYLVLFVFARGGAGDAKMMAAVGAWLGLADGMVALMAVLVAGVLVGVSWSIAHREGWVLARNLMTASTGAASAVVTGRPGEIAEAMPRASTLTRFPYGVAILLGLVGAFIGVQPWHV